jgi:hypothetical protein
MKVPKKIANLPSRYFPAFKPFLDGIYHCLTMNQLDPDLPKFDSGYQTQIVLDAIRKSSKKGKTILLN